MSSQDVGGADLWEQNQGLDPEYVTNLERELAEAKNANRLLENEHDQCDQFRLFYKNAFEQEKARVAELQATVAHWTSNAVTLNDLVQTQAAKVTEQDNEIQTLTARVATLEAALTQAEKEKADYKMKAEKEKADNEKELAYREKVIKTQETQYLETIRRYQTTASTDQQRNEQIVAESMRLRREYFALLEEHKKLKASITGKPPGA